MGSIWGGGLDLLWGWSHEICYRHELMGSIWGGGLDLLWGGLMGSIGGGVV